ncbi:OmpA family protein [Flavobacterium sp. 3HN19-14]|uniref:OmpA family protein n=1 Tax=Flavobacterium sp. 3HN19-14 TaxID=3448133 RepID=UPI003EE1366F
MLYRFLFVFLFPVAVFSQTFRVPVTILFDTNSYALNVTNEKQQFDIFFSDENTIENIEVEGFCDDIGSEEDNLILSEKRAGAVAEFIQKTYNRNVNSKIGRGEIATDSNNAALDETIRSQNRRVTVYITHSVVEKPKQEANADLDEDKYVGYKNVGDTLKPGDKLIFRKILFKGSMTAFDDPEEAEEELAAIAAFFKNNPNISFEVAGHVCCISNSFWDARDIESGKNNLSETRAKKIYDYFIEKGIAKERMTYKGYGRKFPRPGIREGLNKRVEIVITKT